MKSVSIIACVIIMTIGFTQPISAYGLNYQFTNSSNEITNLGIYAGSYLFIDAFATWCDSCRTEMAHLDELYNAVSDQIQMISLSVDPEDTIKKINDFKDEFSAPWDFGLDHDSQFLHTYPLISYPQGYFFDGDGKLLASWVGITSTSKFLKDMQSYIDVPEGYAESNELEIYADDILSNPVFMITAGMLAILLIFNFTRKKETIAKT